ncbi:MAG: hypothetical protein E7432_03410 [Ruminococcaceae bacterium]|nr:hypothetical protein [Oscillospiraceae bacterium]MBQ6836221.1 hypothetical protein [Clostridia bacterium]
MIDLSKILELFAENNIVAFATYQCLDNEKNIVLDSEDVNDIVKLCKAYGVNCVFYNAMSAENSDYEINCEEISDYITKKANDEYSIYDIGCPLTDEIKGEYQDIIDKYVLIACDKSKTQNKQLEQCVIDGIEYLDIFISVSGERIGISIIDDEVTPDWVEDKADIWETIKDELAEELNNFFDSCEAEDDAKWEAEMAEYEANYDKAIEEIKNEAKLSDKLMQYTNEKLRRTYAKELIAKYSKKYGVSLTVLEVESEVTQIYRERKKK